MPPSKGAFGAIAREVAARDMAALQQLELPAGSGKEAARLLHCEGSAARS